MIPRLQPLAVPEGQRYWSVDLEARGVHHFRFPGFGLAAEACLHYYRHSPAIEAAELQVEQTAARMPILGVFIGLSWWHRAAALETVLAPDALTDAGLAAYSRAVIAELEDRDYSLSAILRMHFACVTQLFNRSNLVHEAADLALFTPAPTDVSTSSSQS